MSSWFDSGSSRTWRFGVFVVARKWLVVRLGPVWFEVRCRP